MKARKIHFLLLIILLLFYRYFFSTKLFVAHDWPLLFKESRNFNPFWSIAWDYTGAGGLGASAFKTLWIDLYTNLVYFLSNYLNIPWWLSQRIFWLVPFLSLSLISSYKFSGLFTKKEISKSLASIIYTFNTYIFLIVGGGQFGIAFAYGLAPLALFFLFRLFKEFNSRNLIISGLFSGLLLALDARVSLLIFLVSAAWYLFFVRNFAIRRLFYIALNFIIAILLNFYWILPIIITKSSGSILSQYESIEGVKFLSFSFFSNSLSLLHPNWPENIFGKVYFFRPEFLIIPIVAFSTLLLKPNRKILFLAVLAIIGAFLGKGTNEPFGQVYSFLFKTVPGLNLFRDSTKFFILVALSYSILIPYFLENLKRLRKVSILLFVLVWLLMLKPVWNGELTGIFKPQGIPSEYLLLNEKLKNENSFFRTMWLPVKEKYGYFDQNHPAIDASVLYNTTKVSSFAGKFKEEDLDRLSVKYVLVPDDIDSEIFLKDRKYDDKQYRDLINDLDKVGWLKRVEGAGKIAIFENSKYKDHFWSPSNLKLAYKFINPTEYEVNIQNAKKGDLLLFSEGFDKNWIAQNSNNTTHSLTIKNLNSFVLPEGNYSFKVYYEPQKWVNYGLLISGSTLLGLILMKLNDIL